MPDLSIHEVAALAKLSISQEEEARLSRDFAEILRFAGALQAIDLTDVPLTRHVVPLQNVLREDILQPSLLRETVLQAAPSEVEGMISVPRPFEEGGDHADH